MSAKPDSPADDPPIEPRALPASRGEFWGRLQTLAQIGLACGVGWAVTSWLEVPAVPPPAAIPPSPAAALAKSEPATEPAPVLPGETLTVLAGGD